MIVAAAILTGVAVALVQPLVTENMTTTTQTSVSTSTVSETLTTTSPTTVTQTATVTSTMTSTTTAAEAPTSSETGILLLKITDQPKDLDLKYLNLTINDLILHYVGNISETNPRNQFQYHIPPTEVNITALQDTELLLGAQNAPAGNITKIVFNITSAEAVAENGTVTPLKVVANGKFMININFQVLPNSTATLTLDIQPNDIKISRGVKPVLVPVVSARAESGGLVVTETPEIKSIDLVSVIEGQAASWNKTDLSILVNTENAETLAPELSVAEAAGGAIGQWRRSIAQFTSNHTDYTYLNSLNFTVYVQGVNDTALQGNADITILFNDTLPSRLGETKILVTDEGEIAGANTTAALQGLSQTGLQNVLAHELAHALGLNHTDVETDLMYSEREKQEVSGETICPSNLDIYALASTYQWIETGSYIPYDDTSVNLPQNMDYHTVACTL
jgi:hypothetical protein